MTLKQDTLEHVLVSTWQMLEKGAFNATDPFHHPVLATGKAGGFGLRTVILRHADPAERTLTCYADARSPKIKEILAAGHAGWLFYHPGKKIQVRIHGAASVHTGDAVAQALWKKVKGFSRLSFCSEAPPGSPLSQPSSGISRRPLKDLPNLLSSDAGREHFAAIVGRVTYMDWLRLHTAGNTRARFMWQEDRLDASWIVP